MYRKKHWRSCVSAEEVRSIEETFVCTSSKSANTAGSELGTPQPIVKPYQFQFVQTVNPNDKEKRLEFCVYMLKMMEDDVYDF